MASSDKYTIGLNFGADEPNAGNTGGLAATEVAGVIPQANWNNFTGANGTNTAVVADNGGVSTPTSLTVRWTCPNTWSSTGRGEENNGFTGPDHTLMLGYLDTGADGNGPAIVTIEDIPADLTTGGYDVYVYMLGGVGGRGGGYGVTDMNTNTLRGFLYGTGLTGLPSTYIEDGGADHTDSGDYLVLRGVAASSIRVEATTRDDFGFGGTERAPINAIQLVAREPGPIWGVFGCAVLCRRAARRLGSLPAAAHVVRR